MGAVANLFPATSEADWRKAAEAALKGASLETLVSETADGVRIEPVYPPAEGPRAIRPGGPWRIIARLDHPNADEANAQALDDLANGADGLQVVSSGALGAYGFGLRSSTPPRSTGRSMACVSMKGRLSNWILGPTAPIRRFVLAL